MMVNAFSPTMIGKTAALPVAPKWHWPLQGALGDLRVRYGIKLGLAALLALYCALLLRLEHPSWAALTVLIMMGSHYVGSITVKAAGVKGGLSAVISIVLLKWINPPGSSSIPLIMHS